MTEINKKLDLAAIPPTNNDGDPYILPLDIYKEGYQAYNISNWFKGRVGDNGTPFAIRWYSHGRLLNIQGMRPFIEGQVGDYTIDDSDPDNVRIDMAEDASNIHVVGDVDDTQAGGVAIYRLINQAFPKSGIFYGKIGFMGTQDDGTLVNTGVDIVFKVLDGHMNMLGARKFYVTELEKAWLEMQANFKQYNQEYKDTTTKQAEQFKADTEKALADLNTKIANEIKRAEDTLGDTQASIDSNLASLKKISTSVGALQAQLDADNLETQAGHFADIVNIKRDFDQKLSNIKHPTQAFDSLAQLQAKYPNGADGDFVTTDTGHIYIYSWAENNWKDCGAYQGKELAINSVDGSQLKALERNNIAASGAPIIVDFQKGTLTIPNSFFNLVNMPIFYHLVPGTVPIITEEDKKDLAQKITAAKDQTEKDKLAKTDLTVKDGGIFVCFDPNGQGNLETQLKFYREWTSITWDEIYFGFIQFPNISNFIFPSISAQDAWTNNETDHANYLSSIHAPRTDDYLFATSPWIFDFDNGSITVRDYAIYQYKHINYKIKEGTYKINQVKDLYGYFIYLEPLTNEDGSIEWGLTFDTSSLESTNTKIYLGWIQLNTKSFYIPSLPLSNHIKPHVEFYGPDVPTVDWDKQVIHFPSYWHILVNDREYTNQNNPFDISFKGMSAAFLVIDENSTSYKIQDIIKLESLPATGYSYNLGFIETNTKTFDFHGLSNNHIANLQSSEFPWANKAITCLGDSITQGDSGEGGLIDSYVPRMQKWLQTTPTNAGLCGSKVTDVDGDGTASFIDRLGTIQDQDVVTIFGGINDFQWNAPLGKMSDSADTTSTFYGALKHIVVTLSAQNPKAKFMFITPMKTTKFQYHTYDDNGELMKNGNGNTELDFVNAMKQVAEYYSIPVLDMYSRSNYNPYLPNQVGHDNFTADGLHPTAHGYERIAQQIAKAINEL